MSAWPQRSVKIIYFHSNLSIVLPSTWLVLIDFPDCRRTGWFFVVHDLRANQFERFFSLISISESYIDSKQPKIRYKCRKSSLHVIIKLQYLNMPKTKIKQQIVCFEWIRSNSGDPFSFHLFLFYLRHYEFRLQFDHKTVVESGLAVSIGNTRLEITTVASYKRFSLHKKDWINRRERTNFFFVVQKSTAFGRY